MDHAHPPRRPAPSTPHDPGLAPVDAAAGAPCSFAQERLWLVDRLEGSAAYHIFRAFSVRGALEARALERTLGELVRRHETLRTTFREVDGAPVQVVAPFRGFTLPVEALSGGAPGEREAAVLRRARDEAERPFDLAAGPLFRARLLRLGEAEHVLLLCIHHAVADGWSLGILYRELSALYAGCRDGGAPPLPALPVRYADYAAWQRERLRGPVLERHLAFWRAALAGAPALLDLPADHPRPAAESHRGAGAAAELPGAAMERLWSVGRSEGATLYMVLLAAWQVLLAGYAGCDDVVVGTPVAGRWREEDEGVVGLFVNTLALRADLSGDPPFREVLRRVRETVLAAYDHQELPFEQLVAELRPERSLGHSPIVQAMFSFDPEPPPALRLGEAVAAPLAVDRSVAPLDLSLLVAKEGGGWVARAQYATDLFERGTIEGMLAAFRRLLERAADDPGARLSVLLPRDEIARRRPDRVAHPASGPVPDEPIAPRTPLEAALAEIWREVLGRGSVGVNESFFELGGHSLLATRVLSRVRERFGVEVPLRALFAERTVAALAERVEGVRRADPADAAVVPVARTGALPLSFGQERLWFLDRLEPGTALYNLPRALRLRGALDVAALERAVGEVVRRHEALRTTFPERDGAPVQVVAPFAGFALPLGDLSRMDGAAREAEAERRAAAEAARPFGLAAGPVFRARLLRIADDDHVLVLTLHHAVGDGWSVAVIVRELEALYAAYRAGSEPRLPLPPVQHPDFAAWQREHLRGEALERPLAYWRERLAGAPALLELPADRPRPAVESHQGGTISAALPGGALERLEALARREAATPFIVLLAAFQVLLAKWSGSDDVVVGTPAAGRRRSEVEDVVGCFVNPLVLRTDLSGDPAFREVVRRARETALGAHEHQEVPFEMLVAELRPARSLGHAPLFQVMFSVEVEPPPPPSSAGISVEPFPVDLPVARYDLSLLATKAAGGWSAQARYRTDLFERATVERMLGHLARLLEEAAADPDRRLSALEVMGEAERRLVLEEWNRTETGPAAACVHRQFEAQAARTPGAAAVAGGGESLTFGEVERRANRLAHRLARLGAGPEARVGICVERGVETVVALLAVLKAGAAYLPLDPAYPAERLAYMLEDSGASLLVTQRSLRALLPAAGVRVVSVDDDAEAIAADPPDPPAISLDPANAAYVIYTSGSTGRPRGVVVTHANVAGFFAAMDRLLGAGGGTWLAVTRVSFDIHVTELLWTLARGFRVVVHPDLEQAGEHGTPAEALRRGGITHLQCTPSLAEMIVAESGVEALAGLERLLLGGEAMPPALAARLAAVLPGRLLNVYGPTETTVWSTGGVVGGAVEGSVPIGGPLANTRVYVVDPTLRPQPIGVPGELCIGGAGVARGYLGRPGPTAERFVPDPFSGIPGARLYRTGDRARWRAETTSAEVRECGSALDPRDRQRTSALPHSRTSFLEFLGRLDAQVKIRGYRIEPGEVESALRRHPGVRACAVVAREGEGRLAAYVAGEADADSLREHLRRTLPEHMVPSVFVPVDRLPLTPSGKVDRRALPAPGAASGPASLPPRDAMEARVAAVWREVLGVEEVGVRESFFDAGGSSLLLYRVYGRLREVRGDLRLVDLFRHPTVESLARFLAAGAPPATNGGGEEGDEGRRSRRRRAHRRRLPVRGARTPARQDDRIAVVGMSCRVPGARDPAQFWANLCAGVESISRFSPDELLAAGVAPELVHDRAYVPASGALEDAWAFDAAFFGITPAEAAVMDPQHRVFLECAYAALEDAGCDPARFAGAVGVYAGCGTTSHLARVLAHPRLVAAAGPQTTAIANAKEFLATRVSHRLGLRGPSVSVGTACSTSLVAIHLACQALRGGECDLALAGGVTVAPDQGVGYLYQEGGILSPDGHCRAFDARAAGTVFGSGAGVVALKRLADALRDGDTIRAVVRGSAVNNDGAGKLSFTAPGVEGQARVVSAALAAARVDPATVGYVEAHGTGTPLGDPVEVAALTQAFRAATDRTGFCALGAVKTNVGHLDTAAGVAGFIKAVLALEHRTLPPTLHFASPNPETVLEGSPFFVAATLREWRGNGAPLRAGVSSFGFGGTNAHVVLEEAPAPASPSPDAAPRLLVLSAKSGAALERMRGRLAAQLAAHPELPLADVAHTLQAGRTAHPYRWAAAVGDGDEARALLAAAPRREVSRAADRSPSVAFLFPGQGTQYAGMARALYEREPVFRRELDRCAELLAPRLEMDPRSALFPAPGGEDAANELLGETRCTQPALFAVEYALARLWMSWGIEPGAMLGHSLGEYVAACLAGVFTLDAALGLVAARGRLMQALPPGAMLAVPLPQDELRPLLSARLSLAAVNGAAQCVVSGDAPAAAELEALLARRGVAARRLRTSHAFHSAAVEPILGAFAAGVRAARPAPPRIPFVSNLTGDWITAEEATDPGYWVRHLRETVRFADGVGRLLDDPTRVLLEVGPGDSLGAFARRHAAGAGRVVAGSLPRAGEPDPDGRAILAALGDLWTAGVEVDWAAVRGKERRRKVPLPTYPFERTGYRVPPPPRTASALSVPLPAAPAEPPVPHAGNGGTTASSSPVLLRVSELFAGLLGRAPTDVDGGRTFLELGADSLLLMQASRGIEGAFGVRIPFRRLMEELSTVGDLAAHLERSLPAPPEPAPPSRAGGSDPLERVARELAALRADAAAMEARAAGLQSTLDALRGVAASPGLDLPPSINHSHPSHSSNGHRPEESVAVETAAADALAPEAGASHGPHRPVEQTLRQGGAFTGRQQRHFDALVRRYTARTRRSREYAGEHRGRLADNRGSLNFRLATKELLYPIVGERSQGSRLWDVDGNEYVDFTMGFGVHFFGHRPAFVMEAVEAQLRRGVHLGPQSDLAGPAAAMVGELTGMERVAFCNTGSEAVMTALRIARAVTGRSRVVIFEGSYHGCFDGVLARRGRDGVPRPVAPGTPRGMIEDVVVLPYGTSASLEWIRANAAGLAAVLVEPVQSRDPEHQPREFLHALRALTRRSGTALVFDEMITGFRLGVAGAQGWYGVEADLATYGKVVGGGFPLGIVAGRGALMDAVDGGAWRYGDDSYPAAGQTFFAGTFCKHPAALAAACAVLRHLGERGPTLYDALHARAGRLVAALRAVLAEERVPMRIVHCASIFHFRPEPRFRFAELLFHHLVERGFYIWEGRACYLSTAHTDEECDRLAAALRESIHALRDGGFLDDDGNAPPSPSFPLTPAQQAIGGVARRGGDASRAYHEQVVVEVAGPLDLAALREAVADLARHHEALRTVFAAAGGAQRVLPELSAAPLFAGPLVAGTAAPTLEAALGTALARPFELSAEPPFRLHVHALGAERHVLQLVVHHLAADGVALAILRRDLEIAWRARRDGRPPRLPAAMQFGEYAGLLASARERDDSAGGAEWLSRFAGAAPLVIPYDHAGASLPAHDGAREVRTLGAALTAGIREAARREGCTLFVALLGGVLAVAHRLSGQDHAIVGISSAGRPFPRSETVVGNCAELLPLRTRARGTEAMGDYLRELRSRVLDACEHEQRTYARLREQRSGLPALPSLVFNLEPGWIEPEQAGEFAGLAAEPVAAPARYAKYDLGIDAVESGGEVRLFLTYAGARYARSTIARMLEEVEREMEDVVRVAAGDRTDWPLRDSASLP